jgi:hypothetical protein
MYKTEFGFEIDTSRFDVLDLMRLFIFGNHKITDEIKFDVYGFKLRFDWDEIEKARGDLLRLLKDVDGADVNRLRLALKGLWVKR